MDSLSNTYSFIFQHLQAMKLYHSFSPLRATASRLCETISRLFSKFITFPNNYKNVSHDSQHQRSQPAFCGERPPLIVFILGAPGAGKGTQSKRLRRDFAGLTHLSYGDLLRYQDSIPGSWVSTFPRRGGGLNGDPVLPADVAVRLLHDTIKAGVARGQRIWLMDGFPRSKAHMEAWAATQMPLASCAFFLDCDRSVLVDRILGRAGTSGRADDADVEKVCERVGRNMAASAAMLQTCKDYGVPVIKIDTNRDLDSVQQDIRNHFQGIIDEWNRKEHLA
ncbi:P-loop containing nucleoside triphosphate hydrolase protein [Xylariaceae sp. AK1471]|nr:P-loop containing nucleoside triphosphate hydrolase protein [Xylariaceae sp. AK1471]